MSKIKQVTPIRSLGAATIWGYRIELESGHVIDYRWDRETAAPMYQHLIDLSGYESTGELGKGFNAEIHLEGKEWFPFAPDGESQEASPATGTADEPPLADEEHALAPVPESRHIWPGEIRKQVLAGNATFTIVFGETIGRRTFKVKSGKKDRDSNWSTGNQDKSLYWVSLKIGPGDGYGDYLTIGRLVQDINGEYKFIPTVDKRTGQMHFAAILFRQFWIPLENGFRLFPSWEFYHATTCCVCGRKLTVPESIRSGIGPECEGKM